MSPATHWTPRVCFALWIAFAGGSLRSGEIDFNHDVRPLLSNHCFSCHGVDDSNRAAELRLDSREEAIARKAIIPGDPANSEIIARLRSSDPDVQMPPPSANKPLTAEQIQLLEDWVREGAEYQQHWAFRRIERPLVPGADEAPGTDHPIDRFVVRRLRSKGIPQLSPESPKATLIRRAYQDLLGLLPTVSEVDEFIEDSRKDSYEHLVERLLSSPHYGERWGRHWLDQARYADSNGYTIDGPRIMWPYRDWVIHALNQDLPFDQFTIAQLAGDLLPNATKAQKVASAFHRNTMINQEGGVKPDQYRHEAIIDRVNTTGAVWLGLTIGCAQCHTHKFDPITNTEYYRLYSFFNSATDANNTGATVAVFEQEMFGWPPSFDNAAKELAVLRAELKNLQAESPDQSPLATLNWEWKPSNIVTAVAESGTLLTVDEVGSVFAGDGVTPSDAYRLEFTVPEAKSPVSALRLRVLTDSRLPNRGPGRAGNGNFVLTEFTLEVDGQSIAIADAWADHSQPDYPILNATDGDAKTGWAINVNAAQARAGAVMNANHEAVFLLASPVQLNGRQCVIRMRHDLNKQYLVGRFAIDASTILPSKDGPESSSSNLVAVRARIEELEALLPGKGSPVSQMIMADAAEPVPTYRLERGDFLSPLKEEGALTPGVPQALQTSVSTMAFENRLDLARWIVSRDNPLTARVIVNRVWTKYFGRGLVETENDFGYQGASPTHPELLDWLAAEFMENGWSLKHLHRLIVTSMTYRQSSNISPDLQKADPGNHLLGRQSRFRVDAEIVRDQALAAAGVLNPQLGGPGVYPPQPEGVYDFTQNRKNWPTETGSGRFRRTMYTMFYRSAPYPLLTTFDAPDFSTVCTARVRSNTPLQSLTVANDEVFVEVARKLAERVLDTATSKKPDDILEVMFQRCLTRKPSPAEKDALIAFFHRETERFESSPDSAKDFGYENSAESAAWTSVARVLFNTDEFVTRN
ncbi:MAG: PSD1 domain-containing protein [Planctomycetaceae bacterium]|nr:PSD1 domain-containing protein [Planctomycetaceae bacterium]